MSLHGRYSNLFFSSCIRDRFHPPSVFVVRLRTCTFFFFRPAVSMTLALWLRPHCNLCRTASNSGVKKGHVSHWFIDWLVTYPKPEVSARVRLCTFLYTASVWSLSTKSNPVLSSPFHTAPPFVRGQLLGTAPCFSARERQIVMESAQGRDLWGGRL